MIYSLLADLLVIIHLAFVCFVLLGALLVLKWRKVVYIHIPAAIWGAFIEFAGWICPLTPFEQKLRHLANQSGYSGDFVEHYITKILYPDFLSRDLQIIFGLLVVLINLIIYSVILLRYMKAKKIS